MYKFFKILSKRVVRVCVGLIFLLLFNGLSASAKTNTVQISTGTATIYSTEVPLVVNVTFVDEKLYNEHIFLAYHVEDLNGNVLRYESERYPIIMDENKIATIDVNINLDGIETDNGVLLVKFDIVDEAAMYWYSDNLEIDLMSSVVRCETKGAGRMINLVKQEIAESPIIFCVNFLVFLGVVVTVFVWKKWGQKRIAI